MINSKKNFVTIEEFVQLAIQFGENSADFYSKMQALVKNESARKLLKLLEKEEMKHVNILKEFTVKEDKDSVLQFLPSFLRSMPAMKSEHPEMEEIIEVVIERERKAVEIYENTASMVSGNFKELLIGLARFERQHEEKLRRLHTLV